MRSGTKLASLAAALSLFAAIAGHRPVMATIPPEAVTLQDQGSAALEKENLEEAVDKSEAALKIAPQYWTAAANLSAALVKLGSRIDKDPLLALEKFHRALFFDSVNEKAVAKINDQLRLLNKNPDSFDDRKQLADELMLKGDYLGATVEYGAALAIKNDDETNKKLAEALSKAGERPSVKNRVDYSSYMTALQRKIKSKWHPPRNFYSRSAMATFVVDRTGTASKIAIGRSCGDPKQDRAAIETIAQASPFDPLPEGSPEHVNINFTFDYNVHHRGAPGVPSTIAKPVDFLRDGDLELKLKQDVIDQQKRLDTSGESGQKMLIAALNALAEFYIKQDRIDDAKIKLTKAKTLSDALPPPPALVQALTLTNLGQVCFLQGAYDESAKLLKQAVEIATTDKTKDDRISLRANQFYVLVLLKLNRAEEANKLKDSLRSKLEKLRNSTILLTEPSYDPTGENAGQALEAYNQAQLYRENRQFELAVKNYDQAIAKNPNYVIAFCQRGRAHADLKQYDAALADYTEAIRLDPKFELAYRNRGWIYGITGQWEKAIADDSKAISLDPKGAMAYCNRGTAYRQTNQIDRALEDLSHSIDLNSRCDMAYTELGILFHNQGRNEDALRQYNLALQANPLYEDAYINRGNIYDAQNRYDLMMADYDLAIALSPDVAQFYHIRGNGNYHAKNYDLAIADYTQAIKLEPNGFDHFLQRGRCYHYMHKYSEALDDLNKALALKPHDEDTLVSRGNTYAALGEQQKAIDNYNQALVVAPKNPIIYRNIGIAYSNMQNQEKAIAALDTAIDLNPKYSAAYVNRGYAYQATKQYERALQDFNRAIKLDPNDAHAYINRGFAYSKLGQPKLLLENSDQAIKLDPKSATAYTNRAYANLCLGEYQQAYDAADKAISLDPALAAAYCNRGKAAVKLGKYDQALQDLNKSIEMDPKACDGSAFYYRAMVYSSQSKSDLAEQDKAKARENGFDEKAAIDTKELAQPAHH